MDTLKTLALGLALTACLALSPAHAETYAAGPTPHGQEAQLIGVTVTRVTPVAQAAPEAPTLVLVEGGLDFAGQAPRGEVLVHIGSFSTPTFPGADRWSMLVALDDPALPPVAARQLRLNVVVRPASVEGVLPEGWISRQR